MAATRIQSRVMASNDWLNSFVFSFSSGVTAGSLLVIGVATGASGTSVTSVSDSSGQTWTRAIAQLSADNVVVDIWYLSNANAGTHNVTFSLDDYYQSTYAGREYGGIAASFPLDVTKGAADGDYVNVHASGTSTTTSQANTLSIIFSGGFEDGGTYTAGSGFGNVQYIASSGAMSIGMADRDDTATGTKTGELGTSNYLRNGNALVVFKEAIDELSVLNKQFWQDVSADKTYDAGSGSDRILVVAVSIAYASDNAITSVSYNGASMTAVAAKQNDPYGWSGVRLFYLFNPTSGSNTLAFTTGDDTITQAIATVITGADTTAVGTGASNSGDSSSANVTVSQSGTGNLLIAGVTNGTDTATITATGGSTIEQITTSAFWNRFALVSKPTTGSGTLAIATSNTADGWAIQGFEVRALSTPVVNYGLLGMF